jgi:prolyl-tRNA synthetase
MAKLEHLRLGDLSDREILLTLRDVADDDGWATSLDISEQLSMGGDKPTQCVAQRLSWLRRYGAVDREDGKGALRRWRLTEVGGRLAMGTLKANQERMLEGLDDAQVLAVTRYVAQQARHMGNHTSSKLIEREWKHRWIAQNGWTRP